MFVLGQVCGVIKYTDGHDGTSTTAVYIVYLVYTVYTVHTVYTVYTVYWEDLPRWLSHQQIGNFWPS